MEWEPSPPNEITDRLRQTALSAGSATNAQKDNLKKLDHATEGLSPAAVKQVSTQVQLYKVLANYRAGKLDDALKELKELSTASSGPEPDPYYRALGTIIDRDNPKDKK